MDRRFLLMFTVVVSLAALMTVGILAQGRVGGQVTDEWDNGLEGVTVIAQSATGNAPVEETTDDEGNFQFLNLGGEHTFEFRLAGYQGARVAINVRRLASNRPLDVELSVLSSGSRFRDDTEFEAEGGVPSIRFDTDGEFEFEDADGEGEGTYGINDLNCVMVVRDYDGPDDRYSVSDPVVLPFANDQFTSLTWGEATLNEK